MPEDFMFEDHVTEALNLLRSGDAALSASPETEIRTLLAFRRRCLRQKFVRRTAGIAAALIAALSVVGVWRLHRPEPARVEVEMPAAAPAQTVAAAPPPARTTIRRPARRQPREIATRFYPLMPSAPPLERAMLVRVTVPAVTMRAVGLPVGDDHLTDPVEADVLVGQDDLARAIRFVSYQK